jgi:hypothetical protein
MKSLYRRFYQRLDVPNLETDSQIQLLNMAEIKAVKTLEMRAMLISGLIGTLAVLLLYLPQYAFPQYFPDYTIALPIIGTVALPLVATVYGVALVFLEIWALTLLHVYCIHRH